MINKVLLDVDRWHIKLGVAEEEPVEHRERPIDLEFAIYNERRDPFERADQMACGEIDCDGIWLEHVSLLRTDRDVELLAECLKAIRARAAEYLRTGEWKP